MLTLDAAASKPRLEPPPYHGTGWGTPSSSEELGDVAVEIFALAQRSCALPARVVPLRPDEGNRMKTSQAAPKDIDEYIAAFPKDVQEILEKVRVTIKKAAPDAEEAIKYQIPTFTLNGNLVHFAAFKKHIGFYPAPRGIEEFKEELSVYKGAKGSVQFPLDKTIPFDLISRIVEFRVKEQRQKAASKKESI